ARADAERNEEIAEVHREAPDEERVHARLARVRREELEAVHADGALHGLLLRRLDRLRRLLNRRLLHRRGDLGLTLGRGLLRDLGRRGLDNRGLRLRGARANAVARIRAVVT